MQSFRGRILAGLDELGSKPFLQGVLEQVCDIHTLISFMTHYTVFNGDFAGGVANLAGAFHIRQDLFRDLQEHIPHGADRSSEIASEIFFSAEEEYAYRATGERITHRKLAQILLQAILEYAAIDPTIDAIPLGLNNLMDEILRDVKGGYQVNRSNSEEDILRGLGFHIGAELFADQEFNLIDQHMKKSFCDLRRYLKAQRTPSGIKAYHWIALHTVVEEKHFDHAIVAAEKTLKYYQGVYSIIEVEQLIYDGFVSFASLQRRFFQSIYDHINEMKIQIS